MKNKIWTIYYIYYKKNKIRSSMVVKCIFFLCIALNEFVTSILVAIIYLKDTKNKKIKPLKLK